jgi:hypothetical protein
MSKLTKSQIIKELTKLGYRKLENEMMAKPVAFNLLIFNLSENVWSNHFIGVNDKPYLWSSENININCSENDFLESIKLVESYAKYFNTKSSFEFLTPSEHAIFLLTTD